MFFYRASAETSVRRWESILDDSFQLVLPITPYRSFPPSEVCDYVYMDINKYMYIYIIDDGEYHIIILNAFPIPHSPRSSLFLPLTPYSIPNPYHIH
jgi:hypothetical protein